MTEPLVGEALEADGPRKEDRRPAQARENRWVKGVAAWCLEVGLRPNHVSIVGMGFAVLSATCLFLVPIVSHRWAAAMFAAACASIPFRGLCNICDGLMAIEGGLKTKAGQVFNDLPDRASDSLLLVAAGYSTGPERWAHELGWAAGLLAVMTAYVRVLGGSSGASQQFCGPMDKTRRMIVMATACVVAAVEVALGWPTRAMIVALGIVIVGSAATIARRAYRIVKELKSR